MNIKNIFSVFAGLLFAFGFVPYIRAILRGETKPAKASWIIWGTLDLIVLIGMISAGAINGQILSAVICAWLVVIFAFKCGTSGWNWNLLDKFCLVGAGVGILLWVFLKNPIFCIIISLSVMFIGSIPTFASAWQDPTRENKIAWTLFWISCIFTVLAIPVWTLSDASQPIMFLIIQSIMMLILFFRPQKKSQKR